MSTPQHTRTTSVFNGKSCLRAFVGLGLFLLPLAQMSAAEAVGERNGPDAAAPSRCWGHSAPCDSGGLGAKTRRGNSDGDSGGWGGDSGGSNAGSAGSNDGSGGGW